MYQERGASVNKKYEKIYFSWERLSASSIAAGKPLPLEKNQGAWEGSRKTACRAVRQGARPFGNAQHTDQYVSIRKRPRNAGSRPETPVFYMKPVT